MNLLPKEIFISTLDCLREQTLKDIDASIAISKVFATDAVYDNSLLIRATIKLLQVFFPKGENGFCEIEHYIFDMNFGKIGSDDLITSEDLWDRLNKTVFKFEDTGLKDYVDSIKPLDWRLLEDADPDNIKLFNKSTPKLIPPLQDAVKSYILSTHPLIDDNPNPDGV